MCVAADSNILVEMQRERLEADPPQDGIIAQVILNQTYLALDVDGHCLQEACECIQGPFSDELCAWAIQLENDGKLRRLPLKVDKNFEKKTVERGSAKEGLEMGEAIRARLRTILAY